MTRPMRRLPRLGTCTRRLNQKKQSSGVPPLVMTIWRDVHLSKIGSPSLTSESKRPGAPVEADERRPMIRSVPMLAALFLAGSFSATAALGADSDVAIKTFQFKPTPIEVKAGTRVTWANADDITHTVTSGTPENRDGQFNTPLPGKGTTFSFTFSRAGTYTYFCDRHQSMRGEIRVK